MSDLRKAAELAFDALDIYREHDAENIGLADAAYEALRQALAEPANSTTDLVEPKASSQPEQERKWVGVTYDEVYEFVCTTDSYIDFAKAIEAKLKERNT